MLEKLSFHEETLPDFVRPRNSLRYNLFVGSWIECLAHDKIQLVHRKCKPSIQVGLRFIELAPLNTPAHTVESGSQWQLLVLIAQLDQQLPYLFCPLLCPVNYL